MAREPDNHSPRLMTSATAGAVVLIATTALFYYFRFDRELLPSCLVGIGAAVIVFWVTWKKPSSWRGGGTFRISLFEWLAVGIFVVLLGTAILSGDWGIAAAAAAFGIMAVVLLGIRFVGHRRLRG